MLSIKNNHNYNDDETQITSINKKVLNAVGIDWNAANLGNYVTVDANGGTLNGNPALINTTYELIYQ